MLLRPVAFRIENYKSISDTGICSLSGDGITVLAGQNEAGKTSVLLALTDFNGEPGEPPERADVVPDDNTSAIPTVSVEFNFDPNVLIDKFKSEKWAIPEQIERELSKGAFWIQRNLLTGDFLPLHGLGVAFRDLNKTRAGFVDDEVTEEENELASIKELDEKNFCDVAFYQWPLFDYFDSFDDLLPRKVRIDNSQKIPGVVVKSMQAIPKAVKDFLAIAKIEIPEVLRLAALGDDEKQLKNYLSSKSTSVTGDFLGYWKQRTGATQTVKLKAEFSFRPDGSYLIFYVEDGGSVQFPDQRSRGFVWFLSFYVSLAAAVQNQDRRLKRFILIDEPGSFLHPKAQQDILDVLQRRIIQEGDLVMYSTHSPYLLPSPYLHRVRIVFKEENGKTVIADRLTDPRIRGDIQGDALAPVMTSIGMTIEARLANVQRETYVVEGITDYYYLHAWAKLLKSKALDQRGIIVATGTPNVPSSVSLALAYSSNFAILLDRDNAGNAAADKLRTKMNISAKVIVQPKDALAIEDLFEWQDFVTLVGKLDPAIKLDQSPSPTAAIKKYGIEKVLLARKFAESVSDGSIVSTDLTSGTLNKAAELLGALENAVSQDPVFRVS